MISFSFLEIKSFPFQKSVYKTYVKELVKSEGLRTGDINVVFCSDDYLLEVNKKYLQHDYFTDIITFDYREGEVVAGDVFISVDRVAENAQTFGLDFMNEVARVIFHGVLHLCSYKDKSKAEKELMTKMENHYLSKFKL